MANAAERRRTVEIVPWDKPVLVELDVVRLAKDLDLPRCPIWEYVDDPITFFDIEDYTASADPPDPEGHSVFDDGFEHHCRRIAELYVHGWDNPIMVEFGEGPDWDYNWDYNWPIKDGNHRFKAADFRGDETILALCCGDLSIIEKYRYQPHGE
jgi:hypothetical protein